VAAAGVDYGTLRDLLPKILGQVKALPAVNRDTLLRQMAGQQGVTAMARGGILSGRSPVVIAGEAKKREAYIPLDGSDRSARILGQAAALAGYRLVPVRAVSMTTARPSWAESAGTRVQHVDQSRTQNVTLNGAHQSFAEQRADLLRHLAVVA